jgi:hypothetical protein
MTIFQLDLHRIALLGIMFCAVPAAAQFPEKFTNLQVLPKDISRKQLESTMRGFAFALNVWLCLLPCEKPNAKKFEMDFASDDKDTKKIARVMLANGSINHDYISKLPPAQTPPVQVQCVTCHHGLTQPRQLTSVLAEAIDQKGIDSAVALYHELRQKY